MQIVGLIHGDRVSRDERERLEAYRRAPGQAGLSGEELQRLRDSMERAYRIFDVLNADLRTTVEGAGIMPDGAAR